MPAKAKAQNSSADVDTYLSAMQKLNESLARELVPSLDRYGIDFRRYIILRRIEGGMLYPGAIARSMFLPKSIISRHIDQLEVDGLLERKLDVEDSRRIELILKRKGLDLVRDAHCVICDVVAKKLERLSPQRREALIAGLFELSA